MCGTVKWCRLAERWLVDDWWRRRSERSSRPGISVLGSADIGAPCLRPCTALCLERRASAPRRAAVVTVHGRNCGNRWRDGHVARQLCTEVTRRGLRYSSPVATWWRRERASSKIPMSRGRRTRRSCRSQQKHDLETCLSRLRSDVKVTPRAWTLSLLGTSTQFLIWDVGTDRCCLVQQHQLVPSRRRIQ